MNRAERSHGLLRDQPDLSATNVPHLSALRVQLRQVDGLGRSILGGAPEQHLATHDATRRLDDAEQGLHGHAFATATLAHDAEDLAGWTSSEIPSTAFTTPSSMKKWTLRSRIESSGSACWFICNSVAVGIGGVAETVTDEVERQHRNDHSQARDQKPGRLRNRLNILSLLEQHAQLMAGGRMPSPKKLSEVSLMIITGWPACWLR